MAPFGILPLWALIASASAFQPDVLRRLPATPLLRVRGGNTLAAAAAPRLPAHPQAAATGAECTPADRSIRPLLLDDVEAGLKTATAEPPPDALGVFRRVLRSATCL